MDANAIRPFQRMVNPDDSEIIRHSRSGEMDGTKEIPPLMTNGLGDHEKQIIYEGKTEWMRYTSLVEQHRLELSGRIHQLQNQHDSELHSLNTTLSESQTKELELLDHEIGNFSSEYRHFEDAALIAREEKHKIEQLLSRPLQVEYVEIYLPILIVLAIAEVPINRLAFELFFESMPLISLLIASAIGGLLVFFAHTIGSLLKRLQCIEIDANQENSYLAITLISILTVVLMYFLGLMREKWVDVNAADNLNLESFINLSDVTNAPSFDSFLLGSKGFTLLLLNLAIFTVGAMLSFKRHDPHPFYEKAINTSKKADQGFMVYKKKFELKKNELQKLHQKRLIEKRLEIKSLEEQIKNSIRELDSIDAKIAADRKSLISSLARRIMAYQNSNQRIRKTPPPEYFSKNVSQLIEDSL